MERVSMSSYQIYATTLSDEKLEWWAYQTMKEFRWYVELMDEYNLLHTNDEEQKQFLLLTVKNYRQQYPDRNKSTLMQ